MNQPSTDDDRLAAKFERALELPRDERAAFIELECAGEPELALELASLLASHRSAPGFLDGLAERSLPRALEMLTDDLDPVGDVIGRYEILRRIGAGGMGEVYRARDHELGRDVALKFLPPRLARDDAASRRLRHEARLASALDHPNIAVVHEIGGVDSSRPFIVMAYCGEETLADEIQRRPRPTLGRAIECAVQIADALSTAHQAGIVHGDVKPANLIVGKRGQLKLVDFGVSARVDASEPMSVRGGTVA